MDEERKTTRKTTRSGDPPERYPVDWAPAPRYPVEELIPLSERLFGCRPEVVRGALAGNSQTEFTVDELRKLVSDFLRKKVTF